MKGPKKPELFRSHRLHPTYALQVAQDGFQAFHIVDLDLSQQRGVSVEGKVRKVADQKVLSEDELLNRTSLVGSMIDQNVREHRHPGQCVRHGLRVIGLEVKELAFMSDETQSQGCKVGSVLLVAGGQR